MDITKVLLCTYTRILASYTGLILPPAEGFGAFGPYLPLYRGHDGTQNSECTIRFRSQYSMVTWIFWPLFMYDTFLESTCHICKLITNRNIRKSFTPYLLFKLYLSPNLCKGFHVKVNIYIQILYPLSNGRFNMLYRWCMTDLRLVWQVPWSCCQTCRAGLVEPLSVHRLVYRSIGQSSLPPSFSIE